MNDNVKPQPVTEEEKEEIDNLALQYVNRFFISSTKDGAIILTFGEQASDDVDMRGVVSSVMTPNSLINLAGLLSSFINTNLIPQMPQQAKPEREVLN